eukprot:scaffold19989_cov112-Isochrysis_galbana.AAC.3
MIAHGAFFSKWRGESAGRLSNVQLGWKKAGWTCARRDDECSGWEADLLFRILQRVSEPFVQLIELVDAAGVARNDEHGRGELVCRRVEKAEGLVEEGSDQLLVARRIVYGVPGAWGVRRVGDRVDSSALLHRTRQQQTVCRNVAKS